MKTILSASAIPIERITFTGTNGPDRIALACLIGGGYAVLRNRKVAGTWPSEGVDECVRTFIEMIDRRPPVPAGASAGNRAGPSRPPRRRRRSKSARPAGVAPLALSA